MSIIHNMYPYPSYPSQCPKTPIVPSVCIWLSQYPKIPTVLVIPSIVTIKLIKVHLVCMLAFSVPKDTYGARTNHHIPFEVYQVGVLRTGPFCQSYVGVGQCESSI